MTRVLVIAAALGFGATGAYACTSMKSVKAVDNTTVASIAGTTDVKAPAMSTPETLPATTAEDASDKEG